VKPALTVAAFLILGVSASCGATDQTGTGQATTSRAAASVRFTGLRPAVTVRGAHFAPSEDVRVTLRAGAAKRTRTAHTTEAGNFTLDLGAIRKADRCSGAVAVFAVGESGARATFRLPPMDCPISATAGHSS